MFGGKSKQTNIELIATKLSEVHGKLQVVSFDVFGTLLHRTLPHPDTSKTAAANALHRWLGHHTDQKTVEEKLKERLEIEQSLRRNAARTGLDPECRIDDVFREWLARNEIGPDEAVLQELLTCELEAERSVIYAVDGMKEIVTRLREQGIRTVYVSDMYLRQPMIEELLRDSGYTELFDAGYISCEFHRAKYSGRLFQCILKSEGIEAAELIHIGDDEYSDIRGAKRASVTALRYSDRPVERQIREQSCLERLRRKNGFWEGARWCNFAIASQSRVERCKTDTPYRIGYLQLGPLVCNFIHRVLIRAQSQSIDLLLFPSREGFLLRKVYQKLGEALAGSIKAPKSEYAHITRKSVYSASLKEFGEREIRDGFRTARPTIRGLCTRFTLPLDEVERCARRAGIDDMDQPIEDPVCNSELQSLVSDPEFLQIVERTRSSRWTLLRDYLRQLGFWECRRVGLVDVGWLGTVQEALDVAIGGAGKRPTLHGLFMAVLGDDKPHPSETSIFEGLFHDHRVSPGANCFAHFEEFFETCCRAPHPTVIDYERDGDGTVKPVFKPKDSIDYRLEQENEPLIAKIQAGALDYCDDYVRSLPFQDSGPEAKSEYILYKLDRLIRLPTRAEANTLAQFYHCEDFGLSLIHVPDDSQQADDLDEAPGVPLPQHRLWIEGDWVRKGVPGLNALYNIYRAAKSKAF